jgi:SNF family Na+-dependent transporter
VFLAEWRNGVSLFFGALAVFIPVIIYTYYVFIEAWCLGYAWRYLSGGIAPPADAGQYPAYFSAMFSEYIGVAADGALFAASPALVALGVCFFLNFVLIYRGLAAGIEAFCKWAIPALTLAALVILVRVLTLGTPNPSLPEQSVVNGLGFMWNPKPVQPGAGLFSALLDPQVWLEAAGQIFFTLGVGFGILMTYASYLKPDDDVALSGLTASATNELSEVCLGGLITIPAAFIFLGAEPLRQVVGSTIGLGFHAVPVVFEYLPAGHFFGFLWFALLFLAAIASSISMLQPAIAFLEEGFALGRRASVALLGLITSVGTLLVVYFSKDTVALDVMDFWVGSFLLVVLALFEVVLFGWVIGAERGLAETNRGSDIKVPAIFAPIIRYVCPGFLVLILGAFLVQKLPDQVAAIVDRPAAMLTMTFLLVAMAFFTLLVSIAARRWREEDAFARRGS